MVCEARRERQKIDAPATDWIVIRNRLSTLRSRSKARLAVTLAELGARLGFRCVEGLVERLVYRDFFPRGMTALDELSKAALGRRPTRSDQNARHEIETLIAALGLPLDEASRMRAATHAEFVEQRALA